jgi:hypothetical protein
MELAALKDAAARRGGRLATLVAVLALLTPGWVRAQDGSQARAPTPSVPLTPLLTPSMVAPQQQSHALDLSTPKPEPRPVTRQWWFWTAVGTVMVATTVLLILANRKDGPPASTLGNQEFTP